MAPAVEHSAGYLSDILERKRRERRGPPPPQHEGDPPPARPFSGALRHAEGVAVIAEVKRRSPARGALAPDLDVASLVRRYEDGGAAACSVLTDSGFDGSLDDLRTARRACGLPLLRKDFLLEPWQCAESRGAGADAVLLIVAALPGELLGEMLDAARLCGVEALVEVHAAAELETALASGATLVGVNNRNLHTFEVDLATSLSLAPLFPPHVVRVSESGIATASDARKLGDAGYDAVLVGEALVRSADPASLVKELTACG